MDVCIKNINEEDWRMFKAESAKNGVRMGELFSKIVRRFEEVESTGNIGETLLGKKTLKGLLSREEFKKNREEFRKDFEESLG